MKKAEALREALQNVVDGMRLECMDPGTGYGPMCKTCRLRAAVESAQKLLEGGAEG